MSILSLKTDSTIENETDFLGISFKTVATAFYDLEIVTAYLKDAGNAAWGLWLECKSEAGDIIRETVYMTSGTAKGVKNYFIDKKDDKTNRYIARFMTDSLCNRINGGYCST